jgi:hypothetical protein
MYLVIDFILPGKINAQNKEIKALMKNRKY